MDPLPPLAVVTGGSRGIGLHVVRGLAQRGFDVIALARESSAARDALGNAAGGRITFVPVDLASLAEVRRVAGTIGASGRAVAVLVLNAAVVTLDREMTVDGFERQFAVNHLAPYLLTHELLPLLRRGTAGRIVVVASQMERGGRIELGDLMATRQYHPTVAYGQSKLANVLFTYELAGRLATTGVTVNCLHPGVVRSTLLDGLLAAKRRGRETGVVARSVATARRAAGTLLRLSGLRPSPVDWAPPPSVGADAVLTLATDAELDGVTGTYFQDGIPRETSPQSRDAALRLALWNASAQLVGVDPSWPAVREDGP